MGFPRYSPQQALLTTDYQQIQIGAGKSFRASYSVANLGAMAAPDDMIQVHFTTPSEALLGGHSYGGVEVHSADGTLFKVTEAPTGGLASPTGTLTNYNRNRVLETAQPSPPSLAMYYDGSAATGGVELINEYLGASRYSSAKVLEEWLFLPATVYAISLYNTTNVVGTIIIHGMICET